MKTPLSREELIKKIEAKENVSKVDTSEIKDMSELFSNSMQQGIYRGENFNQPLNDWDVSKVEDMGSMFWGALSFNQPLNDWDVSNVIEMQCMFDGAESFNQPLNDWNVSNVKYMVCMFNNAKKFNQPLNDWDVSSVTNMQRMFYNAKSFNHPLNDWDVSNVESIECMFAYAKNYTYSMKKWKLNQCRYADEFLKGCHLWFLLNTDEDLPKGLPMYDGERVYIGDRKTWKVL